MQSDKDWLVTLLLSIFLGSLGIHRFYVGKNSKVKYVEKHFGSGTGTGKRILNPGTEVYLQDNSVMEMEMVQIKGVDNTNRQTTAKLNKGAKLVVRERLLTHGNQQAVSGYTVTLDGEGSTADIVSRSVAKEKSYQKFEVKLTGNNRCSGHTECDSIIMDEGKILAIPSPTQITVPTSLPCIARSKSSRSFVFAIT